MLRNKPTVDYCGITIVLSNPSRFDKLNLLTAGGGVLVNNHCLYPHFNTCQCDIREMEDSSPWLPNTKVVVLCGEPAMHHYCPDTRKNTLNEMRGSPLYIAGVMPCMATYFPQDAADLKNFEKLNPLSKSAAQEDEGEEESGDVKAHGGTRRSNFAFWMKSDFRKVIHLVKNNLRNWPKEPEPIYKLNPPADEVINELNAHENQPMFFDIETDREEQNLQCFGFQFTGRPVYSVPVLDYNYKWANPLVPYTLKALVKAIKRNTLVAHNGYGFDFFVLPSKYHIPIYKVYDTMEAWHRCFPDVEKSLGHLITYFTYQRFHKDTDSEGYHTHEQMMRRLQYNAKDVFTLGLVYHALEKYIPTIVGLRESVDAVMRSLRPYIITSLQGISYSTTRVKEQIAENDRLMMHYDKIIRKLIGDIGLAHCASSIKGKSKGFFAGSNAQCIDYFHEQLGYNVINRSDKTNKPSLGKGELFKLALEHSDNPVITFVSLFRATQKETSKLKFTPWKDDEGKIVKPIEQGNDDDEMHFM